uniref:RNA-binding protein NOB1 n=1 Tax=Kalanchoe fedtschenkoi TaxID=63787 RepID=A0A7N1A465_KALFE
MASWSKIVKQPPPVVTANENQSTAAALRNQLLSGCEINNGIAVAVVDANAIIQGGDKLAQSASKFVSVPEFLSEVRDPVSRRKLEFLPFEVQIMNPTPEALRAVINFSRATGDLQTLSDVDLKLIALTYTLEAQLHGSERLRSCPPPIHVVKAKRIPEKDLPGWGSNVPNLEEWEALDHEADEGPKASRILPLKDLSLNIVQASHNDGAVDVVVSENGDGVQPEEPHQSIQGPRKYSAAKEREINVEGKMAVEGVDASKGQSVGDDDDDNGWLPAVSKSTHRKFLRRQAKREMLKGSSEVDVDNGNEDAMECNNSQDTNCADKSMSDERENPLDAEQEDTKSVNDERELSSILEDMRLEDTAAAFDEKEDVVQESEEAEKNGGVLDQSDILSQTSENVDPSFTDDNSEQSWMIKSLSDSSVACITSDFAMQNVILQMGLRLLAPGGMQIRQLQRWVLKCHACYEVTNEVGRIFCPKCGNGGTLRKVAVTVGENGVVLADRRQRISIRGTKFSLPLPQSGRDAIAKNPVLREDQLSHKLLYPKTKKKPISEGDDLFLADDVFHHADKRAPLKPPVGKAVSVFIGRKNPNDNHNTRTRRRS